MRFCFLIGLLAACLMSTVPPRAVLAAEDAHGDDVHHAVHIGEAGVNKAPEELKTDLAIYTFVVFLLLLAILTKFAWKPIVLALEQRERRIADNIADAERTNEDAKKLLEEYDRRLAAAQDQVRAILDDARRDAERSQQELLAKAREDAQREVQRGKHEIETATSQALKELAEHGTNLAVSLAGKMIRKSLTAEEHAQLIQDAVAGFPSDQIRRN